jgi:CMP-N-acetylneuraminic acid synthetase
VSKPKCVALVPAKAHSGRLPEKNLRPFVGEKSLLDVKLEQCKASGVFDEIYVSSEADKVAEYATRHGVDFLLRNPKWSSDATPWSEALVGLLDEMPVDDDTYVAIVPVTTPLFHRYGDAVAMLEQDGRDSVMSLTAHKHYFLNPDFLPINYQWGPWHSYSQNIKPLYQMNCAFWVAKKGVMKRNRFQVGDRPAFFVTDATEGMDIDTLEEFEVAQLLFQKRFGA